MSSNIVRIMVVASLMVSVSFLSAGCSKKTVTSEGADAGADQAPTHETAVDVGEGMGSEESIDSTAMNTRQFEISEGRTNGPMLPVYFDFDKSNIRDDQQPRLEGNATFANNNSTINIIIEGNCDERGTNEYNMALGERRAQNAKKYLENLGVSSSRMNTVSYGEDKPLLYGHDEYSWTQNRRDDFIIR